jgi:hypothetical protein
MRYSSEIFHAKAALERAALGAIAADRYPESPHADADAEHADEQLAVKARDLARAVEALPADERPIGWARKFDLPKAEWDPLTTVMRTADLDGGTVPARYAEALQLVVSLVDAPEMSEHERIRRIKLVIVAFGHVNAARESVA